MDKKKLLLVAISVGVVLLIIIGIPLILIAPRQSASPSYSTMAPERSQNWSLAIDPDMVSVDTHNLQLPQAVAETQPYINTVQEFTPVQPADTRHVTTITVQPPETAAVPKTTTVTPARKSSPVRATQSPQTPQTVPAAPVQQAVPVAAAPAQSRLTPAETAKPAAARAPTAKSAVESPVTHSTYWVQTGAFSTHVRAEGAKESLASKGITSIIDNRDIDGKTWYRVRVGPYTSETEANFWLAIVKVIDGFGESQVRQSAIQ